MSPAGSRGRAPGLPCLLELQRRRTYSFGMSEEPDSLVPRFLRRIDKKADRVSDDIGELKCRMSAVEDGIAGMAGRVVRLERIERRRDLIDQPIP